MTTKSLRWQSISKKGKNFEILLIDCVGRGYIEWAKRKKKFGPLYATAYRQFDADRWLLEDEVRDFVSTAKRKEIKKPGSILKSYKAYQILLDDIVELAESAERIALSKFSNTQLSTFLKKYFKTAGLTIAYAYSYYFYQYLGDELYTLLDPKITDPKKRDYYFEIFFQAKDFSATQQSQLDLLTFITTARGKNKTEWAQKFQKKYAYMGMYFFRGRPLTKKDVEKRIVTWKKKDYREELKKLRKLKRDNNNWRKYARFLNFTHKEMLLVETIKLMSCCTNYFDEAWNILTMRSLPLLKNVAQRIGVSYKEMTEMTTEEVLQLLSQSKKATTFFKKIMAQRSKDCCYLMVDKRVSVLVGKELQVYRKRQKKQRTIRKKITTFSGRTASPGIATGIVATVREIKDLSKVKKGNILVAKCTVPAFMAAMERAAGFVTETGGLLSHAAIVAREIKKPCIIGVDHVMEMLKDGDRVRVDATNGIIKKL